MHKPTSRPYFAPLLARAELGHDLAVKVITRTIPKELAEIVAGFAIYDNYLVYHLIYSLSDSAFDTFIREVYMLKYGDDPATDAVNECRGDDDDYDDYGSSDWYYHEVHMLVHHPVISAEALAKYESRGEPMPNIYESAAHWAIGQLHTLLGNR